MKLEYEIEGSTAVSKSCTVVNDGVGGYTIDNQSGTVHMDGIGGYDVVPERKSGSFDVKLDEKLTPILASQETAIGAANEAANEAKNQVLEMSNNLSTTYMSKADWENEDGTINSAKIGEMSATFATKEQVGSWYGMYLATDIGGNKWLTGFDIGAVGNENGAYDGYFRINADKFILGSSKEGDFGDVVSPTLPNGDPMPAFEVSSDNQGGYDIYFNGRTVFENLTDEGGQTVIDGGKIKSDFLEIDKIADTENLADASFFASAEPYSKNISGTNRSLNVYGGSIGGSNIYGAEIYGGTIQSNNYSPGRHGYKLNPDGSAEFNNIVTSATNLVANGTEGGSGTRGLRVYTAYNGTDYDWVDRVRTIKVPFGSVPSLSNLTTVNTQRSLSFEAAARQTYAEFNTHFNDRRGALYGIWKVTNAELSVESKAIQNGTNTFSNKFNYVGLITVEFQPLMNAGQYRYFSTGTRGVYCNVDWAVKEVV